MLTKWTVGNFKSISEKVELDMAPLTVLAGPNSSGKSTIIQSILLVAQTLSSRRSERELLLNGEFVRLGSFTDLLHSGEERTRNRRLRKNPNMIIGFVLERPPSPEGLREWPAEQFLPVQVGISTRFGRRQLLGSGYAEGNPSVSRFDMRVHSLTEYEDKGVGTLVASSLRVTRRRGKATDIPDELSASGDWPYRPRLTGRYVVAHRGRAFRGLVSSSAPDIIGARVTQLVPIDTHFYHFLPRQLSVFYDQNEMRLRTSIESLMRSIRFGRTAGLRSGPISPEVADFVEPFASKYLRRPIKSVPSRIDEYVTQFRELSARNRQELLTKLAFSAEDWLASRLAITSTQMEVARIPLPAPFSDALDWVTKYFSTGIQYLGPLREDPRAVYALPPSGDPADVGLKGEYTAAVLDANKQTKVTYWDPNQNAIADGPLNEAVQCWLRHFGLAESVQTQEAGKLGHILKLREAHIPEDLDLTNVGVGVSQVLPILVMAFMAQENSTLIYEQPEIHLHPKIQSQIADFFLGVIRSGKRCIVETHSEYVVNRIRRRIAESPDASLASQIRVLFVEKIGSVSRFRHVPINKYGAVLDWPEGFFDQGQTEAEMTIDAAMRKRGEQKDD